MNFKNGTFQFKKSFVETYDNQEIHHFKIKLLQFLPNVKIITYLYNP